MLNPRIYRAAFVPVALALVVLAFSLIDQPGPLGTSLAPDAFNAQTAYSTMTRLANSYPDRWPGSVSDEALAADVGKLFRRYGFGVSTDVFTAATAQGSRPLETVTGVRTGFSNRPVVVLAHRDAVGSPATSDLSGTATLLELARVLSGRTLNRTVILASTSGSVGASGALRLAGRLAGSADAVIVLGDLAGTHLRAPLVGPFSDGQGVAPPILRNTVAAALGAQAGLAPGELSLGGQFARLAFPLTISEQGPFGAQGEPAVLLSSTGERLPAANEQPSQSRLSSFGRTVLQTISALEDGPAMPAPSPYLVLGKKLLPAWAIRLLVLSLILPVLAVAMDGSARARRRGHALARWAGWVLAGAAPFALAVIVVLGLELTGLLRAAPPEPVAAGAVPLHTAGVSILVGLVLLLVIAFALLRPLLVRLTRTRAEPSSGAAAPALLLVMCAATIAIWVANPFEAALVIPALHLWVWVASADITLPNPVRMAFVLVGIAPVALVAVYYAFTLGIGPVGLAWTSVLMLAGGHLSVVEALEWSVVLGCAASVITIALRAVREGHSSGQPITVRGPATYAGPGSLGGTSSALRR